MTTLVTADLHLSDNPRDAYRLAFMDRLPDMLEEHDATRLLVLGDLTEAKDGHKAWLVNEIVDRFAALAALVDVVILKGNHDYLREDVPFYRFLGHLSRVRWINVPTSLRLRGLGRCLFIPHTTNWPDDLEAKDADWIFCHQTFDGADAGHGRSLPGISHEAFPRGSRVVAGDVHVPQKIGPVTYAGAPCLVDFGDDYDPRVLILDGNKMRSVPYEGPQKRLVSISSEDVEDHLESALPGLNAGDVVKVRVDATPDQMIDRAAVRRAVREWGDEVGVNIYATQIVAPRDSGSPENRKVRQQRSDEQLVRAYAKKMDAGSGVLKVGLKLVEKA